MSRFFIWFVKITGIIPALFYYKTKTYYAGKKPKVKGKALIVSNHKSVMDYGLYIFSFLGRNLRTLTAEVIYEKGKLMSWFLRKMGCIRIDRDSYNFDFMNTAINILEKKGVVLVFPEARIPEPHENYLLEFKPSYIYMALEANAPIIPVYTNGSYGKKKRAEVVIGEPIDLDSMYDENKSIEENIKYLNDYVRSYIDNLGGKLNEKENTMDL